jgi:hypothetical protein
MHLTENQLRLLALASEEKDSQRLLLIVDEVLAGFDTQVELPDLHQVMEVLREQKSA